jgi:predicted Ser/Thr protein kinase
MKELIHDTSTSKIYRLSPGIIEKIGKNCYQEGNLQLLASELGIAPKVYEFDYNHILMEKIQVYPEIKLLKKDKLAILEQLWSIGISHNDTHIYNWGQNHKGQNCIIDFGCASEDKKKLNSEMRWCRKLFNSSINLDSYSYRQSDISK